MDLLLHLIDRNKLNIYDIQISLITDQYLEYIELMTTNKMELMSSFIEMAAILLNIKSKTLLPKTIYEEDDIKDPRLELVEKLVEYKKYKIVASKLREKQFDASTIFYKNPTIPDEILNYREKPDPKEVVGDVCFEKLYEIFQSVVRKSENKVDTIRSGFGEIKREEYTIQDKIDYIMILKEKYSTFSFRDILENQTHKSEIIVTFLAILELIKLGTIKIYQQIVFDDIYINFN